MILTPDRRIIAPARRPIVAPSWRHPLPRRPLRRRRHRPYCPLFNMADGDLQLVGTDDGILLDADGNRVLTCCCGGLYIQARKCVDNTYADLWFLLSDHTDDGTDTGTVIPFYFTIAGVVYLIDSTSTTSATPGTLAAGYTSAAECPPYIQAKLCSDGTDVDLWFLQSSIVLPFYFKIGTTRYFVASGNNVSPTPGTLAAGYTTIANCYEQTCCIGVTSPHPATPRTFIATIAMAVCPPTGGGQPTFADLSGTYTLALLTAGPTSCSWVKIIPNALTKADGTQLAAQLVYACPATGGGSCPDGSSFFYSMYLTYENSPGGGFTGVTIGWCVSASGKQCCDDKTMVGGGGPCPGSSAAYTISASVVAGAA